MRQRRRDGAVTAAAEAATEKVVASLARRIGPRRVRPALAAMKIRGLSLRDGITLATGETVALNLQLTVGALSEAVEVTGSRLRGLLAFAAAVILDRRNQSHFRRESYERKPENPTSA